MSDNRHGKIDNKKILFVNNSQKDRYKKEKVVVAFGLGKFFRDTYERLFQMVDVKYVCDNDSTKWGKEFYGKKCISPSELSQIENVFVIIVMGDCRSVMKQLQTTPGGGYYICPYQ